VRTSDLEWAVGRCGHLTEVALIQVVVGLTVFLRTDLQVAGLPDW
jgi:hypothetical protein